MKADKNTFFIAHGNGVVHYGFVEKGKAMDIGQPVVEKFETEAEYIARLAELGVTPEPEE